MKKKLFAVMIAAIMCLCFTACGGSDENTEETQATTEQTTEATETTTEEAVVKGLKYEDFLGTWETTTAKADENFGGYKITFNEDMTFEAIVTGEEETGSCTFENGVVTVANGILNDRFQFTEDGVLFVKAESGQMATLTKVE